MALLHMLVRRNCDVIAAHCNFHLRGEESDRDEKFVTNYCHEHNIRLEVKHFDTLGYAKTHKVSVEVAARELRYRWFEQLRAENRCDVIAVAHHKNDQAETVLLNMIRGAGVRGMRGMLPRSGNIVRPLLGLTRAEIEQYCAENGLKYITDSTNNEDIYRRNIVRHKVLPLLESLNPQIVSTLSDNAAVAQDYWLLLEEFTDTLRREICREADGVLYFDKHKLQQHSPALMCLMLEKYGFKHDNINQLFRSLSDSESKEILSESHIAFTDKDHVVVAPNEFLPTALPTFTTKVIDRTALTSLVPPSPTVAYFDADKLSPDTLQIRRIEAGDRFTPLGMSGKKKVSDFLLDAKLNRMERLRACVLCNGDDIAWLVPHRISQKFAITPGTTQVLVVEVS